MSKALKTEKSAGFLIFRRDGDLRFLILKSKDRLDIPKGQLNPGEGELEAALRELKEETGISDVKVIAGYRKNVQYFYRWGGVLIKKTVIYFLAEVSSNDVKLSKEHDSFSWMTTKEAVAQLKYKNLIGAIKDAESLLSYQ
jgi:bis(5'-nucleosidyl)-tetraphosphatase